jgi:hypothetical protein
MPWYGFLPLRSKISSSQIQFSSSFLFESVTTFSWIVSCVSVVRAFKAYINCHASQLQWKCQAIVLKFKNECQKTRARHRKTETHGWIFVCVSECTRMQAPYDSTTSRTDRKSKDLSIGGFDSCLNLKSVDKRYWDTMKSASTVRLGAATPRTVRFLETMMAFGRFCMLPFSHVLSFIHIFSWLYFGK